MSHLSWSHAVLAALLAALLAGIVIGLCCEYRLARKTRNRLVVLGKPQADSRDWLGQFKEQPK